MSANLRHLTILLLCACDETSRARPSDDVPFGRFEVIQARLVELCSDYRVEPAPTDPAPLPKNAMYLSCRVPHDGIDEPTRISIGLSPPPAGATDVETPAKDWVANESLSSRGVYTLTLLRSGPVNTATRAALVGLIDDLVAPYLDEGAAHQLWYALAHSGPDLPQFRTENTTVSVRTSGGEVRSEVHVSWR